MESDTANAKNFFVLKLFNSRKKKSTELILQSGQTLNIYLCGPTVYDHIHIGNLRPVIIFDILHRLLLHLNIRVNYIQNITDIDDKIIIKAQKEKKTESEISRHYAKSYWTNLIRYNILFATRWPRVSNYISQIQDFIGLLIKNGAAYQRVGEVFFRIEKNPEYGKLSGQVLTKLKEGTREITSANKESNHDFVLWKKTTVGKNWPSPWGAGRPGWHTECAAFINKLLHGQTLDIHGGGNDLLFPHHENERIQYLVANGRELSQTWLHIAHINWGQEKMSKSLGNVISAKQFCQKYGANVLRYLILNAQYNQVINLSEELIQQATDYIQKIKNLLKKLRFFLYMNKTKIVVQNTTPLQQEIVANLLNNLNTVKVLFFLEQIINFLNRFIDRRENDKKNFSETINNFYFILDLLGFKFTLPTYNLEIKLLIKKWQDWRNKGDYIQADKARKRLQELDII
ncbi:Cysteine--tRNA ligase [endosymbiont DhMRE of Dentiscutata heterogama]|uniref:cysteine--tRNA ligase n=1 Tax=endosymbiont DhMRE of Dentiscutata heterogama TaxID=1609546 RepID=UPI000629DCE0|nr:cysteine--tRNA ligase [endosymbiont DhMRE of Dentiscutata heterogama]CFW92850.1 Cysteine--tRNA ligase [endosymbiont DhMRE of Dentiscutata heterogama]